MTHEKQSNATVYYFLAADPACANSSGYVQQRRGEKRSREEERRGDKLTNNNRCLSIQRCPINNICNPTLVVSLALPSSPPSAGSALMYLALAGILSEREIASEKEKR